MSARSGFNRTLVFWSVLVLVCIVVFVLGDRHDSNKDVPSAVAADQDSDHSDGNEPLEFHGYPFTRDCSGQEAGYQWAQDHNITDPDDCGGNSESFIEGCKSYAVKHFDQDGETPTNPKYHGASALLPAAPSARAPTHTCSAPRRPASSPRRALLVRFHYKLIQHALH
jgi:hypothetical protein